MIEYGVMALKTIYDISYPGSQSGASVNFVYALTLQYRPGKQGSHPVTLRTSGTMEKVPIGQGLG